MNATFRNVKVGSHVTIKADYFEGLGPADPCVHEVIDVNMNWGYRIAPISPGVNGKRALIMSESRWIDIENLDKVFN